MWMRSHSHCQPRSPAPRLPASPCCCPWCRTALRSTWPQRSTFNWQILATASASTSALATCAASVGVRGRARVCVHVCGCACACGWLCVTGPHNFHLPLSAAAYFIPCPAPHLLPTLAARARRNLWALLVYYYIVFSTLLRVLLPLLLSLSLSLCHMRYTLCGLFCCCWRCRFVCPQPPNTATCAPPRPAVPTRV